MEDLDRGRTDAARVAALAVAMAAAMGATAAGCGGEVEPTAEVAEPIVGGAAALPHQFPWQAFLGALGPSCGASLLSPSWVVTAGHCVQGQQPGQIVVHLGEHNWRLNDGTEQQRTARRVFSHLFGLGPFVNDIALVELASPVTLNTASVLPIAFDTSRPLVGSSATASGWGSLGPGLGSPDVLNAVSLPILAESVCGFGLNSLLCTGDADGSPGICNGDSGGPLAFVRNARWYLGGVTSSHQACAGYTGFTSVSQFVPWIRNTIFAPLTVHARLPAGGMTETHFDEGTGAWTAWRNLPDATVTTQPSIVLDSNGRQYAFACAGGAVVQRTSTDGVTWPAWSTMGGNCVDSPGVTVSRDSTPQITVFARAKDNVVRWAAWTGGVPAWTALDGTVASGPRATTTRFGRLIVVARRSDQGIWWRFREANATSWSGWSSLGGAFASGPAAFETPEGFVHVFATGADGIMRQRIQDPRTGAWGATWTPVMGQLNPAFAPAVVDSIGGTRMDVFALHSNGAMNHWYQDIIGGNWFVMPQLPGSFGTGPGAL